MSRDWVTDIAEMHEAFGATAAVENFDAKTLRIFLEFRLKFLQEEMRELEDAISAHNPEEIVDALVDLCVVAIGTLDAFNIDGHDAWDEVLAANRAKEAGVNESRPNPLGLPDLFKPEGWIGPDHGGNHGLLTKAFKNE